ncbi:TonB-dependent receptor [Oscillospiraceae bacterium N12]|jgi:TonB-linked SusC/RagA family outer membrane protein|uniref:TonB-dependent receptor n=1 Tax=Jilunia laotingensis TaxID=2763675 RepID=A0A926F0X0_9BACT|nr:TonB-dependent receptor [Jilunia laotingensis]MBC8592616.1 TonB-dependent receptor [Jilunia laotingensis]
MKIKHLDGLYNRSVFRIMTMILFFLFLGVGNTFSNVNASNAPDEQLQQGKKIKGVVRDETGEPIIGANVIEKGTSNGLITDLDGAFSLEVKPGSTLVISYIGYISQEIPITDNTTTLNIKLVEDSKTLDEVVVVGYGTMKKSDLTGSVSSFRKKDMNQGVNSSLSGLLQGKAAGVQVTQASAEPGGGITIQVRGAGSVNAESGPLYVVDGLPIETSNVVSGSGNGMPGMRVARSPISNINPADIESIEILKDASATAIYGARGANGVVLVTTKKGASGKMKVNYSGFVGMQVKKDMIEVLNAEDYKRILNEIQATPGSNVSDSEIVGEIQDGGTDWQNEMLRTAVVQSHSLSFTGGTEKTKFFTSLNYFDQDGIMKNTNYKRYDGRVNLDYKEDRFNFGTNITASYTHDDIVPIGFSTNEEGSALYAARGFDPTLRTFNDDGTYQTSSLINLDNPLALLNGKTSQTSTYRTLGTAFLEYTILKGWTVKANLGFDYINSRRDSYVSEITKSGKAKSGIASILTGTRSNYLTEFTTNYNRDLPHNSSINAMAGFTYQKFSYNSFDGNGSGFPVDEIMTNNMGMADPSLYGMGSSKNNNKLMSYIGRVNYNMFDVLLFTATLRIDGSSRFGKNNRFGYFPSGAVAWKLHQHDFIKNLNVFSNLKARASFGRTGNQDIGNFLSIVTYGTGAKMVLDGKPVVSFGPQRIANPDLKWETTEQINVGLDMGFFDNRLSVSLDYFQKNTFDMLFNKPIPASTGYTSIMQNVGNIRNRGFELTLDSRNFVGAFTWNTSLNLSTLKNKVTDLSGLAEIIHGDAGQSTSDFAIIREGEALNSFFGYQTAGIWQSEEEIQAADLKYAVKPGDVHYVDQNGDGVINSEDRVVLGKSIPSFTFGLTNELSYKNFTLNFFIDGATGFKILNNAIVETLYPVSHRRNRLAEPYLNRWTEDNPSNKWPSFVNLAGRQGGKGVCDLSVEDGSYIRLQTVQLSYNVPLKSNKIFSKLGFYILGQNLLTLTGYSGQDPTLNSNGNSTLKVDFNAYPSYRTFSFGVEIGF